MKLREIELDPMITSLADHQTLSMPAKNFLQGLKS